MAQGKALLTLWERALISTTTTTTTTSTGAVAVAGRGDDDDSAPMAASSLALRRFSARLKNVSAAPPPPPLRHCEQQDEEEEEEEQEYELSGHLAPIWAAVTCAMGVTLRESVYVFLLNHAKAVVGAAVRASVMGPYAAQGVLASGWLRGQIEGVMSGADWDVVGVEEAGQGVPMCDLWVGRHELLYSRIFNS